MSSDLEAETGNICCASCDIAEVDVIKLKECNDCDLVRYCSDECQAKHRPHHESKCKERAAELRDEILFRQPESSHHGDCPICFLPLSIDTDESSLYGCCSKLICNGCAYANQKRAFKENLEHNCPFCRKILTKTQEEMIQNNMKRADANDPVALQDMAKRYYHEGDYERSFQYWTKAAELGDAEAHHCLSIMYAKGEGAEKNEKMELYHEEEAAIRGHPTARHFLACMELINERFGRAVKHWIIAANLGFDESVQALKTRYADGKVSKEDFAAALRAHHAAVDATKSPQREAAAKAVATGWRRRIY